MKRHRAYMSDDSMAKFIDLSSYDMLSLQVNEKTRTVKVLKRRHGSTFLLMRYSWNEDEPAGDALVRAKKFLALLLKRLIRLPVIESRQAETAEQYMDLMKELRLL